MIPAGPSVVVGSDHFKTCARRIVLLRGAIVNGYDELGHRPWALRADIGFPQAGNCDRNGFVQAFSFHIERHEGRPRNR